MTVKHTINKQEIWCIVLGGAAAAAAAEGGEEDDDDARQTYSSRRRRPRRTVGEDLWNTLTEPREKFTSAFRM